jgi:FAD/FMN-containing dehydrogenase
MPKVHAKIRDGEDLVRATKGAVLSRGLGRAYGDAALPAQASGRPVVLTPSADRILDFDPTTGVLRAEAGFSLRALREIFMPRGWFTPVSPGTRHVTLGGMVAADIHGKNHHVAGCIGEHVRSLKIRTGDGRILHASRENFSDLFDATFGAMGLTGHILEVELALEKVPSPWIYEESERYGSLREVVSALNQASQSWPMTVAWIDTTAKGAAMGRGIVMKGRWAKPHEAPPHAPRSLPAVTVPFDWPNGLVNPLTIGWLNTLWYLKHGAKARRHVVHPEKFFWILDSVNRWNRVFGRRGFVQYQCVLPSSVEIYTEVISRFQSHGGCSFVTVFKDCGAAGRGHLSFPQPGTSLALDIPYDGDKTKALVDTLNKIVVEHGGRIYLAKDALTSPADFRAMYPRLDEFLAIVRKYDPEENIGSLQSQRLLAAKVKSEVAAKSPSRANPRPRASTTASRLPGPQVQQSAASQTSASLNEVLAAGESAGRARSESNARIAPSASSQAEVAVPHSSAQVPSFAAIRTDLATPTIERASETREHPIARNDAEKTTSPEPPRASKDRENSSRPALPGPGSRPRSRSLPPPAVKEKM